MNYLNYITEINSLRLKRFLQYSLDKGIFNVEFDDVYGWDAPDFCDAFICYAEHEDGTPLTDEELEAIEPDQVYDLLMKHIY